MDSSSLAKAVQNKTDGGRANVCLADGRMVELPEFRGDKPQTHRILIDLTEASPIMRVGFDF